VEWLPNGARRRKKLKGQISIKFSRKMRKRGDKDKLGRARRRRQRALVMPFPKSITVTTLRTVLKFDPKKVNGVRVN